MHDQEGATTQLLLDILGRRPDGRQGSPRWWALPTLAAVVSAALVVFLVIPGPKPARTVEEQGSPLLVSPGSRVDPPSPQTIASEPVAPQPSRRQVTQRRRVSTVTRPKRSHVKPVEERPGYALHGSAINDEAIRKALQDP